MNGWIRYLSVRPDDAEIWNLVTWNDMHDLRTSAYIHILYMMIVANDSDKKT